MRAKFPDWRQRGDLDDLIQEVLLSFMRNAKTLQRVSPANGGRFRYVLMRVAYNPARNARRHIAQPREWAPLPTKRLAKVG